MMFVFKYIKFFIINLQVENEIKSKMILVLDYFKVDVIINSNLILNVWNFLFMVVSGFKLYYFKLIL